MRSLSDLITEVQENCGDQDATYFTNAIVARHLDKAFRYVWARIIPYAPELFYATYDVSTVANTRDYDLPYDFAQILKVEDREGVSATKDGQVISRKGYKHRATGFGWELRGHKFRLRANPSSAVTDKYRLHYVYKPVRCVYGSAGVGSTGTRLDLSSSPTDGNNEIIDDSYNNSRAYIVSGPDLGNIWNVIDYTGGSTLRITLETGAAVGAGSVYSIVPDVPEFAWELVVLRATIKCLLMQNRNPKLSYYKQEYREEKRAFNAVLRQRERDSAKMITETSEGYGA